MFSTNLHTLEVPTQGSQEFFLKKENINCMFLLYVFPAETVTEKKGLTVNLVNHSWFQIRKKARHSERLKLIRFLKHAW